MRIKRSSKLSTKTLMLRVILTFLFGLVVYFLLVVPLTHYDNNTKGNRQNSPTEEEINDSLQRKKESVDESANNSSKGSLETGNEPDLKTNSLSVIVPYADSTHLTVLIEDIVNGGACSLRMVGAQSSFTKTVPTQAGPSSSTCQGFNYEKLPPGNWTATVTVTSQSLSGTVVKDIIVE